MWGIFACRIPFVAWTQEKGFKPCVLVRRLFNEVPKASQFLS